MSNKFWMLLVIGGGLVVWATFPLLRYSMGDAPLLTPLGLSGRFGPFGGAAVMMLGVFGATHRSWTVNYLKAEQRPCKRLLWQCVIAMGLTLWLGAAFCSLNTYKEHGFFARDLKWDEGKRRESRGIDDWFVPVMVAGAAVTLLGFMGVRGGTLAERRKAAAERAKADAERQESDRREAAAIAERAKQAEERRKASEEREAREQERRQQEQQLALVRQEDAKRRVQEEERQRKAAEQAQVAAMLEQAKALGAKVTVKQVVGNTEVQITLDPKDAERERQEKRQRQLDEEAW